jgi:hypothetical protein
MCIGGPGHVSSTTLLQNVRAFSVLNLSRKGTFFSVPLDADMSALCHTVHYLVCKVH